MCDEHREKKRALPGTETCDESKGAERCVPLFGCRSELGQKKREGGEKSGNRSFLEREGCKQ